MPIPRLIILFAVLLALAIGCAKKVENVSADTPPGTQNTGPGGASTEPSKDTPEIIQWKQEVARNLLMVAIGVHYFHDVHVRLPGGTYPKDDTKLGLSWRVMSLENTEDDPLYKEFKLEEPWDSDHNKKLINRMPKRFRSGGPSDAEGKTHFRSFGGRGLMTATPKDPQWRNYAFAPGFAAIKDGDANTLLVATIAEPIVWTKPDALDYQDNTPLPKFGGLFNDGYHIVMADGKVRFVPNTVPEATMRAIITRDGGEKVELPGEEIKFGAGATPEPKGK